MQLEQSFDVAAPIERVWAALIDVEQVAPCLPGASITARNDDGTYEGAFAVKIGPTSASYTGKLEMTQVDQPSHTATMQANGTDRRGQGGASATIVSKLTEPAPGTTRVDVNTEYKITGRLARFGRGGMIEDISERLLKQFAANLQASLAGSDGGASAPDGGAPATGGGASATKGGAPVTEEATEDAGPTEPLDVGELLGATVAARLRQNPRALLAGLVLIALLALRRRRR